MSGNNELKLKKFDIKKIKDNSNIFIIGKRGTGKSFLAKDILYYHRDISAGTVISPTEVANYFYYKFISNINVSIYNNYDTKITSNFLEKQKEMKKLTEKNSSDFGKTGFLIFDDCINNDSWKKDKYLKEIFMSGKFWRILFILTMSYPFTIPPHLRANLDYIFIFPDDYIENRRKIYDYYAGIFKTFEIFCNMMNKLEKYECLVIDYTIQSSRIEDCIFWYKAEDREDFRIEDDIKN